MDGIADAVDDGAMRIRPVLITTAALISCGGSSPSMSTPSPSASPPAPDAAYEKGHDELLIEKGPPPGQHGSYSIYVVHPSGEKALLDTEGADAMPSWTPDGRIIFTSERSGSSQIWIMNGDGSDAHQISRVAPTIQPAMAQLAKNGLVVFMAADMTAPDAPNPGIWVMHEDGSGSRELTKGTQPSLALSGKWITYTFETEQPYHREIWRIDTDGTGMQQLTFLGDPDYPDANASNISPDETMVAFFSGKESDQGAAGLTQNPSTWGHRNVAVIPAGGGARRVLTHCKPVQEASAADCIAADNPAWSPDGKWIVHDTDKPGVWMTDLDGNESELFYSQSRGAVRVPLEAE